MRPKVIAAVILLALVFLGIAALMTMRLRTSPAPSSLNNGPASNNPAHAAAESVPSSVLPASNKLAESAGHPTSTNAAAIHEKFVEQRSVELNKLAMKGDAGSLEAILAETKSPDKAIRHEALEAAIQSGDRSTVVPRLQEIASQTEDPAEKTEILAAIDYINLPSLTEYIAEKKAARALSGQTNPPPRTPRVRRVAPPRPQTPATTP
jgi:hypothetical protein